MRIFIYLQQLMLRGRWFMICCFGVTLVIRGWSYGVSIFCCILLFLLCSVYMSNMTSMIPLPLSVSQFPFIMVNYSRVMNVGESGEQILREHFRNSLYFWGQEYQLWLGLALFAVSWNCWDIQINKVLIMSFIDVIIKVNLSSVEFAISMVTVKALCFQLESVGWVMVFNDR